MFSPQVVIQTSAGTDYAWFWMDRRNLAMSVSSLPSSRLLMALRLRSRVRRATSGWRSKPASGRTVSPSHGGSSTH